MPENKETPADPDALLARIEAALVRGETAAGQLGARQQRLRVAARQALDILDRLIDSTEDETDG